MKYEIYCDKADISKLRDISKNYKEKPLSVSPYTISFPASKVLISYIKLINKSLGKSMKDAIEYAEKIPIIISAQ